MYMYILFEFSLGAHPLTHTHQQSITLQAYSHIQLPALCTLYCTVSIGIICTSYDDDTYMYMYDVHDVHCMCVMFFFAYLSFSLFVYCSLFLSLCST